uniref:ATP-dependent DNA helicase n=1 Tax=Lactuca sativa TaxID=4236 RepID=A0A9R1X1G3_LACSA|nr:hypothetical protein LSAT_V11C800395960 [Lactuca sativa]
MLLYCTIIDPQIMTFDSKVKWVDGLDRVLPALGLNRLIAAERTYNVEEEIMIFNELYSGLNVQHKEVYTIINNDRRLFFISGCGGTCKTYLWRTIIASIQLHGKIVLSVVSSSIASLSLPGGRITHSKFNIPIDIDKDSACGIDIGSDVVELINIIELIIWDEAPLQHRYSFEVVDHVFHDICRYYVPGSENKVFGGKVVAPGVIFVKFRLLFNMERVLMSFPLVYGIHVVFFVLTTNMCLYNQTITGAELIQMREFCKWLLGMGVGRLPTCTVEGDDDATWITIVDDLLIPIVDNPIDVVTSLVFPDIFSRVNDISYIKERCIRPKNDDVDMINLHVLCNMSGDMHEITDNFAKLEIMYPLEFLNTLRFSGIPNHKLNLKVGVPIILLRNLNLQRGLCSGTMMVIIQISRRVLEAVIITGTHIGEKVLIGRIDMTAMDTTWPFRFKRRQFPVKVCFTMTINKSQGQTFNHVCEFLVKPVFSHGQLYVTTSRVTPRVDLHFYIDNNGKCGNNMTKNVVYK